MSGEGASGGAVNFVTRQPHRGKPQHEVNLAAGSFGSVRSGVGSGGTTGVDALDYRIDLNRSAGHGFIDDTRHENWHLSGGLDWYARPGLKLFGAVEFKRDDSNAYWGTPLWPRRRGLLGGAAQRLSRRTAAPMKLRRAGGSSQAGAAQLRRGFALA